MDIKETLKNIDVKEVGKQIAESPVADGIEQGLNKIKDGAGSTVMGFVKDAVGANKPEEGK